MVESKEERVKHTLSEMLNELLSYGSQQHSFVVTNVDLEKMKFSVDFNIVEVEEDGYIGFVEY
tara:strand:- start:79 stop:267 length:189 start_codon:yes stop_codon:yes gene_type:complete